MSTLHTLSLALDLACLAVLVAGSLAYLASVTIVGSCVVELAPEKPFRVGLPVHLEWAYWATLEAREEATAVFPLVTLRTHRANVSREYDRNVIPSSPVRADCYRIADGMAAALGPRWFTD